MNHITLPKRVEVLQPNGTHAFYASSEAAVRLLNKGDAKALGRRKAYAIRLFKEFAPLEYDHAANRLDRSSLGCASRICVNARELFAPSPRHDFGFEKALTLQQKRMGYTTNRAGQQFTAAGKLTAAYRRIHAND